MNNRRRHGRLPRKRGVVVELQHRDRFAFKMLMKARVLQTGDFVPLAFPSRSVAVRRLRKLHDAGFVACYVEQLHIDNRWMLDQRGWEVLAGKDGDIVPIRRAPQSIEALKPHRATLVRLWSLLAHACHSAADRRLRRFTFEWELPKEVFSVGGAYRPDAVVVMEHAGSQESLLIEVDTGSEAPSYVLKRKFDVFETLRATRTPVAGVVPDLLLVLVPLERRRRSLARALRKPYEHILTAVFDQSATKPCLEKDWMSINEVPTERTASRGGATVLDRFDPVMG